MRRYVKTLLVASTLAAGMATAPALYAHDSNGSGGSMMGPGMMGQGGMMDMMGQMSSMMEGCNQMMQAMMADHGAKGPDEQGRDRRPEPQDPPQQGGSPD